MGLFDAFRGALTSSQAPSAAQLAHLVEEAVTSRTRCAGEVTRLEGQTRDLLTAPDAPRAASREALRKAREAAQDAELYVAALRERLAETRAAEAAAERVIAYDAARVKRADGLKALAEYARLATAMQAALDRLWSAEVACAEIDADLPPGFLPLGLVEVAVRDAPSAAEEILNEQEVRLWCAPGVSTPLPDHLQATVNATGLRRVGITTQQCESRSFTRIEYRKPEVGAGVDRLSMTVRLPGLRAGDPPFVQPSDWRPETALQALRQLRAAPRSQHGGAAERPILVRYEPRAG